MPEFVYRPFNQSGYCALCQTAEEEEDKKEDELLVSQNMASGCRRGGRRDDRVRVGKYRAVGVNDAFSRTTTTTLRTRR